MGDGALSGLLRWFEPRRSAYPWRRRGRDPYATLVSEVMLQQTQAARVTPAFERFMARYPTVASLAAAPLAEVIRTWSGLGYNRRAVALWRSAGAIVGEHGGRVPEDPAVLGSLPGVGPYTAAAVASIGFGVVEPALDTNARRVVARALLGVEPHQAMYRKLRGAAAAVIDRIDPGGWNQAVMDLGREHCRSVPRCDGCPVERRCAFRTAGRTGSSARKRQPRYEGSNRQVRGAVLRALSRGPATLAGLVSVTGHPLDRVEIAVGALAADGLVRAGPAALAGRPRGRARLP
jgi:A/G-specific adenine glycosylase